MSVYKYLKTSKNIKIMATYNVTNGNDSGAGVDLPLTAVYRLYNSGTDSYFYTTDRSEVNYISEVNGSEGSLVDQEPEIAFYTVDV